MKWCVLDPMTGSALIVHAGSALHAARKGTDALVEAYPAETTCDHCETVTLSRVEVWPIDDARKTVFESRGRLVRIEETVD